MSEFIKTKILPNLMAPGTSPDKPFVIFALLLHRTVGNFVLQNAYAASVKRLFKHAKLYCYYRNDRPYKAPIIAMNPYIDKVIEGSDPSVGLLADYFDEGWQAPFNLNIPLWVENNMSRPDLILHPSAMNWGDVQNFPSTGYLGFSDSQSAALTAQLVSLGLNPNKWFCCIHYREPTYQYRAFPAASDTPQEMFVDAVNHIIDNMGGQVVGLGHPGMQPFPERPGFINLAPLPDAFLLQAFALSRARYTVAAGSGMCTVSWAVGTPTLMVNCSYKPTEAWGERNLTLMKPVLAPTGERIPLDIALKENMYYEVGLPPGYQYIANTNDEVRRATKIMHDTTSDCEGWRHTVVPPLADPPGVFSMPKRYDNTVRFVDLP